MQPISTMRWPSAGSSPVVSVSSTISRMSPPSSRQSSSRCPPVYRLLCAQHFDDLGESAQGQAAAQTGRHDEIGAPALVATRHLLGEDGGKAGFAHPRSREDASALQEGRRADDDDGVAAPLAAALEEQWNIEHHERNAARRHPAQETLALGAHQRMKDLLEPAQRRLVVEDAAAQLGAIDAVGAAGSRKGSGAALNRRAVAAEPAGS